MNSRAASPVAAVSALPLGGGAEIRSGFASFPSGVVAMASQVGASPLGMVASSFTVGVSLDPPLVSVAVQSSSSTWPLLRSAGRIGISVLSDAQGEICRRLSGKEKSSRFDGLECETMPLGAVFIRGAVSWLDCAVYDEVEAGDHRMVFLEVMGIREWPGVSPLVFHGSRFRGLNEEIRYDEGK